MALGLTPPSEGAVELFGADPMRRGARALDGVAGFVEAPRFYPYMSARKNLRLLAALDGGDASARIDEVLEIVELSARARHKVGGYSHGMRQRLGIAAALLRRPRLLILDEPATGLDPAGMRDMRLLIRRLADEGITVLLSSHQLPEVQELCDRVAIVESGRVVYEGALADLRRQGGAGYRVRSTDEQRALTIARAQHGIEHVARDEHGDLTFEADERDVGALSLALAPRRHRDPRADARSSRRSRDLFFRLTERGPAVRITAQAEPSDAHDALKAAVRGARARAAGGPMKQRSQPPRRRSRRARGGRDARRRAPLRR